MASDDLNLTDAELDGLLAPMRALHVDHHITDMAAGLQVLTGE